MKILIVHSNFNQRNKIKQPWRITYELSRHLAKFGHEVVIFTDVNDKVEFRDALVEVKSMNREHLRFRVKLMKPLLKDFDIILYFGNSLSGIYLCGLKDIYQPLVLYISSNHYLISELRYLSLRELTSHWINVGFSLPPLCYMVRLLNKDCISRIIVPNNSLRKRLIKLGVDGQKILVFPVGFDIREYLESESNLVDIKEKLGFSSEEFIITYLGSPLTIRGTDTLIKATYLLKKWLKRFRVLLLLRVDSKEEVKEEVYLRSLIKKLNISSNFYITSGVLSRERIKEYIHVSDVVALPFKIVQSEPPISVLESMALGKPVITTRTCGLPELIGYNRGVLVNPNSPNDLALAIYQLYHDPERRNSIGKKAREFMFKQLRWASVAKLYEYFFKSLLR